MVQTVYKADRELGLRFELTTSLARIIANHQYYQVMFPAVRNPGSANSMQIAEVELRVSKF